MLKYLTRGVLLFIFCYLNTDLFGSESPSIFLSDSPDIKTISPRNLQRTTSLSNIKIIVPEEQKWKDLTNELQGFIRQKTGKNPEIRFPDPAKFVTGWSGNTIILGNLGNNKQMARLYGLRLSYADAIYPGKGGYQLLSIIDPFGLGGNTILISSSDIEGAKLGLDRLKTLLQSGDNARIPWLFESKLPKETISYFRPTIKSVDEMLSKMKPVVNSELTVDALLNVLAGIKLYGEYFQLTANPEYGEVYADLLKGFAQFVNKHPSEAIYQLNERKNMWIQGEKIFQNWTVLEASPFFSDSDRTQILSALLLVCKANYMDNYLVKTPESGPRWNHEIFPALSLVGSCQYFEKYYSLPEIVQWKNRGERIFSGNTSYISLDEGSDYLAHLPVANIDYAMLSGDLKFINLSLRPSADLHSMMIDNLGTLSGGGDTYPFGMSSAYSWGHSQLLNAASWYYNEPVYNFLLERTRTGPFTGQKMPDLIYPIHRYIVNLKNPVQPDGNLYPKVQAQEIEKGVYDDLINQMDNNVPEFQKDPDNEDQQSKKQDRINVDQNDSFHKLTFRSGFGLNDNYLILDGFSAGKHGHQDGNAILNFSSKGRLFLNDRDYIQNTPEYHSGLVIVKGGKQSKKPPLVKLDWLADLDGTGISSSIVPDYNGADWKRTIISPEGKFFIIFDDLNFIEAGRFLLKNHWQSLGSPKIEKNRFLVEQKGISMQLQSLSAADLRLKDIYGHFIKYWKTVYPYPYADHETVLTEVINEKEYMKGDQTGFINVLSSHSSDAEFVHSANIGKNAFEIISGNQKWLAVKDELNSKVFSSNGKFNLIGDNVIIAASVTKIRIGNQELNFKDAVFFKWDRKSGEWKAFDLLKDKIKYKQSGETLRQSAIDSGKIEWKADLQSQILKQIISVPDVKPLISQNQIKSLPVKSSDRIYSMKEQVSSSFSADLNGDNIADILLGGINGNVNAIDSKGNKLWEFSAKGRVNEVSFQYAGNKALIFIATENWYVHTLDINGKELWNYKFPDDQPHREYKGNLIGITNVRIAHKNGKDQQPVIMVGTQYRYIYELDLDGKLKNEKVLYYYGIEDMEYADLDADGKEEGVFALEYYYYTLIKNNELITGKTGGPGWKVAHVLNKGSETVKPTVLLGTKQSEVRMIGFDKKIKEYWTSNVGGEVNDIRHGDFNNDGKLDILVGTEGFQFYVLDDKGNTIFRKTLNDRVLKVEGYQIKNKSHYIAATAQGRLFKFSNIESAEESFQFPDEISNIFNEKDSSNPLIILRNGDVYRLQ
ncbi:MAG: hypothetical protein B7X86_01330 [Sphingobacteriales bacterium 17-39-43]|nr:MAG: hypothetical protein B7Y24_01335 [Sphingobacteriales bacterium 16-39-50]OZA26416.1 MAG: hypothetical protein B7X86_01330 [Sphingobacteriales bacterium 17-39-43]